MTGLAGLVSAAAAGVLAGRPWVTGEVRTAVAGTAPASATGVEVGRGLLALVLVAAAAVVVGLTAGRRVRVAAGVVALLAAAGTGTAAVQVLASPGRALAAAAAGRAGGPDTAAVQAAATPWVWAVLASAVVLGVAGARIALARSWDGLGRGYEAPRTGGGASASAGAAETRGSDLWDALTRGDDPT